MTTLNSIYLSVQQMPRAVKFYEQIFDTKVTTMDDRMSVFGLGNISLLLFNPKIAREKVDYGK